MKGCRPLSDAEVAAALAVVGGPRNRALLLLGIKSGFRISELLSLRVKDVFQNGSFVDEVAVARCNMKKKLEGRSVPLHAEAKAALSEWIGSSADPELFVFQSRKGLNRAMNRGQAWRILKAAFNKCGLNGKLGTHSMRKTFAKKVYDNTGKDLIATQEALGHRSMNSTAAYLSFDKSKVRDAILKS